MSQAGLEGALAKTFGALAPRFAALVSGGHRRRACALGAAIAPRPRARRALRLEPCMELRMRTARCTAISSISSSRVPRRAAGVSSIPRSCLTCSARSMRRRSGTSPRIDRALSAHADALLGRLRQDRQSQRRGTARVAGRSGRAIPTSWCWRAALRRGRCCRRASSSAMQAFIAGGGKPEFSESGCCAGHSGQRHADRAVIAAHDIGVDLRRLDRLCAALRETRK